MTVEENVLDGGFGSSILEFSSKLRVKKNNIDIFGLNNKFLKKYGTQEELLNDNNLTGEYLSKKMYKLILHD